ncbi:MAG: hypothetical protein KAW41_04405 [Candidatus Diapherotrites archaeon]|nr:hypothetical protein [Candidatus Diapherotrites archaeon]
MGDRGFIGLIPAGLMLPAILIILGLILFLPIVAVSLSSELMLLFQVAAAIMVFSWVRNVVGPGMLSYAIAGVLIYIFVFILPQFTLGLYIIWTFMGFGLFGMLFWGLTLFKLAQ